jgi:hypothetical protein
MASIHQTAEGLRSAGAMDKRTLREFDEPGAPPVAAADASAASVVQSIPEWQGGQHEEDSNGLERKIKRSIPHR